MKNKLEKEIKTEIIIDNIKNILTDMHKYLYEIWVEEMTYNESCLKWGDIEKYYNKLDKEYREYENIK